jgi:hypothetical protein
LSVTFGIPRFAKSSSGVISSGSAFSFGAGPTIAPSSLSSPIIGLSSDEFLNPIVAWIFLGSIPTSPVSSIAFKILSIISNKQQ